MSELFLNIVNRSISASWVVVAVLVLRFCLKKAPKWVNVLLWGLVAARMLFPFSIESALSLIPSAEPISPRIMTDPSPSVQTGVPALNQVINPVISGSFTPAPGASANPLQLWIPVFTALWLVGAAALFLYSAVSYWHLRRKVCEAVILRDNIYQSEAVGAPFVLGIIKPKIYLPYQIDSREMDHVIAHEQTHIRRRDHWWKPLGFLLLTIHWFNPLMWLSYVLLCRDIELACDERVIKEMGNAQRADYTQALVACSVNRRSIAACPLAFGEIGVKERVKSVMNYKKPAFWIVLASVIVCAVIAVCFLTNPIGFHFDASANTIVSANHLDMRNADDPVAIEMTPAQISELSSRLAGVKHCRRSDKYAGLTAGYQISALLQDGTYLRISGYHLSNNAMVDLEQNGKRYTVSDKDFQDYLSRVCAGEDAAPAQDHPSTAALPSTDLSTPEKIAALLDAICASPAQSSNPSDYVAAHSAEYQKLINYGAYTLLYCYKEFLKGGQTDLKGWIMALACQSIADAWGETPEPLENAVLTGQDWFDGFFSYAFVLEKNHTPEEMAKDYPCSLLLLQCAPGFYDSLIFDVDGDGIQEICILAFGRTSGLFTFTFRATELGTNTLKYDTSFWTEWYDLSFVCGEDGVVRVQGIDQKDPPQTHLFDIAVADGAILLTEDGVSISYR